MAYQHNETIFALSTGLERAAIAVMRVSGAGSAVLLQQLCGTLPAPRRAVLRRVWRDSAVKDNLLDEAVVIWFPGPESYTGEDGFELHLHAGPAIISAVAEALVQSGARPAEPGEFTRRAFTNGRMDLVEAEGIADLIAAETESQRKLALAQSDGALSKLYQNWRERLKYILAYQEALIDFPDENLPQETEQKLTDEISNLIAEMQSHLQDGEKGERIRRGVVFAIAGPPNAGKSSLLNWLAERDAAIVSSVEGTTRDAIEVGGTLAGVRVTFIDTAGLRETEDIIEAEGVRRALFHVKHADCVLQMFPGATIPEEVFPDAILIGNKADLFPVPSEVHGHEVIPVSLKTGEGLKALRHVLERKVESLTARLPGSAPLLTRARHRAGVQEAQQSLAAALEQQWPELRGEEIRLAMRALGRITGLVGVEDVLDAIFGQFCIGK